MSIVPDVPSAEPIPPEAKAEVLEMLASGDLFRYTSAISSPVSRLENRFAEMLGYPFALAVNSCSSALFLSLKALDLPAGAKVLVPAFTFAAVPSAVVHASCEPVLVNVGDDYRVSIDDLEAKLSTDVGAVMISHMRGHTSDMDAILALCTSRGIPVIEDAAHSLGTTWSGQPIGTIGTIGCFSFQSYKLINAGEGGMLVTRDPDIIARAIIMSGAYEHNWKKHPVLTDRFRHWQNRLPLFNLRMNNLSAAVAHAQIADVARRAQVGRAIHDTLAAILNASSWLRVPASLPQEVRAPDSIQFNLCGFDSDEEAMAFQAKVQSKGVPIQIIGLSEDNARAFWNWQFMAQQSDLASTRRVLERTCDLRLSLRLARPAIDALGAVLVQAAAEIKAADSPAARPRSARTA